MLLMKNNSLIVQYIFGLFLGIYTYLFYFILPKVSSLYDAALNVTFMGFIVFILVSSYLFHGDFKEYIKSERYVILFLLLWFLITFVGYGLKGIFIENPEYYSFFARNYFYLTMIFLFVSMVKKDVINRMLVSVYIIYFIYGLYLIPTLFEAQKLGITPIVNKNVVGFFILPTLAYIFMKLNSHIKWMVLWYIIGIGILYLTGARTSLFSFILLPIMIIGMKVMKNKLRLFYVLYVSLGLLTVFILTYVVFPKYEEINLLFTNRIFLWQIYIDHIINSNALFTGIGRIVVPEILGPNGVMTTLHPHNQFITILLFNGLVGLTLYLLFILFSIPKQVESLKPADGVIFVLITIQFSESIIPFFDFFFISFIFVVNLFINRSLHKSV